MKSVLPISREFMFFDRKLFLNHWCCCLPKNGQGGFVTAEEDSVKIFTC
jgi:hypothetical protein